METISLNVRSPKVSLPGLDDLITRMERADELITKLERSQTIRIKFAVSGDEKLQVAATNLNSLAAAFKSVGDAKVGENLAKGLTTPGEAAKYAAAEVEKLKLRFKELNETAVAATGKFQGQAAFSAGDLENLAARRKAIEGIIGERNAVQTRMEGLQRAGGMAAAMSGGVDDLATAERGLAPASKAAGSALSQQEAIVREKIAAMQGLTAATQGTTAAEREQATAAGQSAQANAAAVQNALLSEKVVRDSLGREEDRIRKLRTGPGQTITTSGRGASATTVEASDTVQAHRAAFEEIDADFAARKAALAQQGFGAGSSEQLDLLRQEVVARRDRVGVMQAEGLGAESLAQKQRLLAAGLEKMANVGEVSNRSRLLADAEASSQRNLTNGLREQIAILDRQYQSARAAAQSQQELAAATRQRANDYRSTAADVRSAEKLGGLAPDATRESYLRAMETKAARLEADARQMEQRLAAAAQANTTASQIHGQQFSSFGGDNKRTVVENETGGGRTVRQTATMKQGDQEETLTWTQRYGAANEVLESKLTRSTAAIAAQGNAILNHLKTAVTWIAAYAVIGKSIEVVKDGFVGTIELQRKFASLEQIFRGTHDEALALGDASLKLGVAEGRSADEATDASIRWSRLGVSQTEAMEAVDVSLQTANVAQITAAEGAEQLSAIYAQYGLQMGELRTVLNEVNTVSNTLNVTNKDLFAGIARTGAVAKQAHVPLAELIGLIGGGVSRTGRSGAEIGNALKATIVSISNPGVQKKLQGIFDFNVKTAIGDLKDFSEVFSELYVKVQGMDDASRGELLQKLGGKQQASRLQAILDGYVTAQVKAIQAQQDVNSAERESVLIRGTVMSQMQSLTTEFQRLFYAMLTVGGESSMMNNLRRVLGGVRDLVGFAADHPGLGIMDVELTKKMNELNKGKGDGKGDEGRMADEIGLFNRKLEEAKGQAGAAEMSQRLAETLGRSIPTLAGKDPKAADANLRQFAMVTGKDEKERNLTAEELVQLRQANDYRQLEVRLQEISAGFGQKKREAQEAVAKQTAETLAKEDAIAGVLEKQITARRSAGGDTRDLERRLADVRKEIEDLKGGAQKLLREYLDEDGFDPLDAVKKKVDSRAKTQVGGIEGLFGAGVGSTETDKLDRKMQALAAEEAYLKRLEAEKSDPSEARTAEEEVAQQQLNIAIGTEVEARREAIEMEREKIGLLRETAALQDRIADGEREGKNRIIGAEVGRNETEKDRSEMTALGGGLQKRQVPALLEPTKESEMGKKLGFLLAKGQSGYANLGEEEEDLSGVLKWKTIEGGQDSDYDKARKRIVDIQGNRAARAEVAANPLESRGQGLIAKSEERLNAARAAGDPAAQARETGELTAYGNRLLQVQLELAERRYRLESEIANARAAQNAEASKALQMASREDQVRAALLTKFVQQNGAISGEQFQFLDKDTREAAQKFVPDAAPTGSHVQELEQEQALLIKNFDAINKGIESAVESIKNSLGPGIGLGGGAPAAPPQINAPNITFNLGEQFEAMTKNLYSVASAEVTNQVAMIGSRVDAFLASQRAGRAQGAGAGSINS